MIKRNIKYDYGTPAGGGAWDSLNNPPQFTWDNQSGSSAIADYGIQTVNNPYGANVPDDYSSAAANSVDRTTQTATAQNSTSSGGGFPLGTALASAMQFYQLWKNRDIPKMAMPKYGITPEIAAAKARSSSMANQGYTGAETAGFMQNLNSQQANAYKQIINNTGSNAAQGVAAILAGQKGNELNKFAMNDASLHRQNIAADTALAHTFQQNDNMNKSNEINNYYRLQQAYGALGQAAIGNAGKALNGLIPGVGDISKLATLAL